MCFMLSVITFLSSAVLHFPPRSYHGETCFPFLAEQVCTGLWRGGSPGSFCSWELQCKYHNFLTECAAGEIRQAQRMLSFNGANKVQQLGFAAV